MALLHGLDRQSFLPTVFCLSDQLDPYGPEVKAAGIELVVLSRRGHLDLGRALGLGWALRRRGIQVVHAFLLEASIYAALAKIMAVTPVLITSNRVTLHRRSRFRGFFDRWALGCSDRIIVNSNEVMRFTCREYHLPAARFEVIYNGLDPSPFDRAQREEDARREMGAAADDLLVGTVGRLAPQKNPDLFLDVVRRVHGVEPRARFVWIGEGGLAAVLRGRIAEAGLESVVRLTGLRSDVPRLLKGLDLFLLTSDAEGLPNVVLEAMAARRAVVATDAGGTREAVGEAGLVRAAGDGEGLAAAVLELLNDPAERSRRGDAGRERIERLFLRGQMVERTQKLYHELASAAGLSR
jgi:starch synthase (maltosyl-transferring)